MTPTLLSAFWTYTPIITMMSGSNNILALGSVTSHGFRQSTHVLARMSLGSLVVMLLCVGISFSLAVVDPAVVYLLGWAGAAHIVWLTWEITTSPTKEGGLQTKPTSFWASSVLQFMNVKIILYGVTTLSTLILSQIQALGWVVGVSVSLAMIRTFGNVCWTLVGYLFQRLFRQYGRQLNITFALLLVYCVVRIFY